MGTSLPLTQRHSWQRRGGSQTAAAHLPALALAPTGSQSLHPIYWTLLAGSEVPSWQYGRGAAVGILVRGARNIQIEGLRIHQFTRGIVIQDAAENIVIRNCELQQFQHQAVWNRSSSNLTLAGNRMLCGTETGYNASNCVLSVGLNRIHSNEFAYAKAGVVISAEVGPVTGGAIYSNLVHDIRGGGDGQCIELVGHPETDPTHLVTNVHVSLNSLFRCDGGGIALMNAPRNRIYHNVVLDSSHHKNFGRVRADREGAITLFRGSDETRIVENTLYANDVGIAVFRGSPGVLISDNIIASSNLGISINADPNQINLTNNVFRGNARNVHPGNLPGGPRGHSGPERAFTRFLARFHQAPTPHKIAGSRTYARRLKSFQLEPQ
jgi:hypothetical protein